MNSSVIGRASVLSLCIAATLAQAQAQSQEAAKTEALEEVIVTGFRQSLKSSTEAKRESVGFVDAIYAEDIGKFPDTNIAESFQRIPGIQITREISGEGQRVAIRGLDTNFTRILLNNAPVAVASSTQEGQSANREVPLDLFPSELFSQLTVSKTSSAEMLEGGAAGTVNMRMSRPFDHEGQHITYQVQGMDNSNADSTGSRGSLIASSTWGSFGALVGVAGVRNKVATEGFETVGWASMALSQAQCGAGAPCNTTGGNGPGTPATVPDNASTRSAGLTPGAPIDQAFLLANNPGRTIQQIDNAIIPRLGRPMFEVGDKDRYSGIVALEFRPSEDLHFFLDSMYSKAEADFDRVDMMWGVRAGSQGGRVIPTQLQVDREDCSGGCVATSGVFPNSQFLLEYRPYVEDTKFWGTNPGLNWQMTDRLNLDVQGNFTTSDFRREAPTVLLISDPATVRFTNSADGIPQITSDVSPNNPANFHWLVTNRGGTDVGRVNVPIEKRETETKGGRFALTWGDEKLNLKGGAAWDQVSRDIRALGNDQAWSAATCGANPTNFAVQPNAQPACRGESSADVAAANAAAAAAGQPLPYPTYLNYTSSLIPDARVPSYLRPTRYGFVTVNWDAFARDSNFAAIQAASPETAGLPTTAQWGSIDEEATALFTQLNGDFELGANRLRYNVGVRWVKTDQTVTSRLTTPDSANATRPEGSKLADTVTIVPIDSEYENWLPSANLSWNITDNAIVRAGLSRSMTRANPTDMLLGLSIRNSDVSQVDLGNPDLKPFLSDNIDLGFEYYTGAEGYIGVAAFRKGIEGFTQRRSRNVTFGDLAQFGVTLETLSQAQRDAVNGRGGTNAFVELRQTVNATGRLTINGLELNWVQPLDFLLSGIGMDGFGITANYTIIDQQGKGAAPAIATNVPPESYNATFYYENHGVSARISVTHSQGSQNSTPGNNEQGVIGAATFNDEFTQWDFSSSFDFGELFGLTSAWVPQLTVDVINLTDTERRIYSQFQNATWNLFESGRTVVVGLRGRF